MASNFLKIAVKSLMPTKESGLESTALTQIHYESHNMVQPPSHFHYHTSACCGAFHSAAACCGARLTARQERFICLFGNGPGFLCPLNPLL